MTQQPNFYTVHVRRLSLFMSVTLRFSLSRLLYSVSMLASGRSSTAVAILAQSLALVVVVVSWQHGEFSPSRFTSVCLMISSTRTASSSGACEVKPVAKSIMPSSQQHKSLRKEYYCACLQVNVYGDAQLI